MILLNLLKINQHYFNPIGIVNKYKKIHESLILDHNQVFKSLLYII